jgi:hypothetical protein
VQTIVPDVQIDGHTWTLIAREGENNLVAYGQTLSAAVKNMEFKYKVSVSVPDRFKPFAEAGTEDSAKASAGKAAE